MRSFSSTAVGRLLANRALGRFAVLLLLTGSGMTHTNVLAEEAQPEALDAPARERLPAIFYNGELEASWVDDTHDGDPYLTVVPSVSVEEPRVAIGLAGKARFNLSDEQVDDAHVELVGSLSFRIHRPWKYRLVFGANRGDRKTPDEELEGTAFDPSGQSDGFAVQIRGREQKPSTKTDSLETRGDVIAGIATSDANYEQDSIFTRSEEFKSWTFGYAHRRDEANGSEAYSSTATWYVDYVLPFDKGDGGALAVAVSYSQASYPRSTIAPDHEDEIYVAGLRYRYRFDARDLVLPFPWQVFVAVGRATQDSDAPVFDQSNTVISVGFRFRAGGIEIFDEDTIPENEDSTTLSPTDLGPPRPRPGP